MAHGRRHTARCFALNTRARVIDISLKRELKGLSNGIQRCVIIYGKVLSNAYLEEMMKIMPLPSHVTEWIGSQGGGRSAFYRMLLFKFINRNSHMDFHMCTCLSDHDQ